jgi:hypothetical protein
VVEPMNPREIQELRDRTMHYLSDDVAAFAGMNLDELQRFVSGTYHPNDQQLDALAKRMHLR